MAAASNAGEGSSTGGADKELMGKMDRLRALLSKATTTTERRPLLELLNPAIDSIDHDLLKTVEAKIEKKEMEEKMGEELLEKIRSLRKLIAECTMVVRSHTDFGLTYPGAVNFNYNLDAPLTEDDLSWLSRLLNEAIVGVDEMFVVKLDENLEKEEVAEMTTPKKRSLKVKFMVNVKKMKTDEEDPSDRQGRTDN